MTRRFALTRGRLAAALDYFEERRIRPRDGGDGGAWLVPSRYETPDSVIGVLDRLYGRAETINRGEVAYWVINDDGIALRRVA